MIEVVQNYLETLFPTITFGQIQDDPDALINCNIVDTGRKPFFKEDKVHILNISLYVRQSSFEEMQNKNGEVSESLVNIYDETISNCHIVNTKITGSGESERDIKNRYYLSSSYEMMVEEIGGI